MKVKQPRVGYINPKTLEIAFSDDSGRDVGALEPVENISPDLIEVVVVCMTIVKLGTPQRRGFPDTVAGFSNSSEGVGSYAWHQRTR